MARVKIFSQPTCPACNDLKDYLKKKGIDFEDMDITVSKDALNELTKVYKVRVTPLMVVGDKKLIGFDPVAIDRLLAENP